MRPKRFCGCVKDSAAQIAQRHPPDRRCRSSYPGLLWIFTGTPEFFDTRHGVAGLAPLHDRIRFIRQGKYASVRQAQLELLPFEASRLKGVAMRLREMFPARDKAHLEARINEQVVDRLVGEVTRGFKGDVGVVPRQLFARVRDSDGRGRRES